MKASSGFLKTVQNNRGIMTAEVIFALAIAVGMICLLFCLTFTLSVSEVAQYIAFSASRAHAAGDVDIDKQKSLATAKFNQLMSNTNIKPLFTGGSSWFTLTNLEIKSGPNGDDFSSDYPGGNAVNRVPQVGVRLTFTSRLLDFKMPLLGSTTQGADTPTFSAKITAFLIREPSQVECQTQMAARYSAILQLDKRFQNIPEQQKGNTSYIPLEDNGC